MYKLEAESVTYSVGSRQLLTDVYLSCETGEIVGLLGRNGSGKSTLLQIIFGTRFTKNKNIRINEQAYPNAYKNADTIAYLPQHSFLPKNIKLSTITDLYLTTVEKKEIVKQDPRVKEYLHKTPKQLSKGELRYFELLLLLQLNVKFLLLDEPFASIEPLYVEHIECLLRSHLHTKGFIITDHDYRSVLRVSNRVVLLADGCCRPINNTEELRHYGYLPHEHSKEQALN